MSKYPIGTPDRPAWKKDTVDKRDFKFLPANIQLPPSLDLRQFCPSIYDQGQLGSCTANAAAAALEYDMIKQVENDEQPSRLFIYYNTRNLEGTTDADAGASIRDTIKSIAQFGACPESEWPYDISVFTSKPDVLCYTDGLLHKAVIYKRVSQDATHIKAALVTNRPVVFGFTCYDSLESAETARTGDIPYPDTNTESQIGGHAICLVGYDDHTQKFLIRNSWGTSWGNNGYGTMPYKYVLNKKLAQDFWIVETVV